MEDGKMNEFYCSGYIVDICGTKGKECGICYCADGHCIASSHEDLYMPATEEQVRKRLAEGRYPLDKEAMEKYLEKFK